MMDAGLIVAFCLGAAVGLGYAIVVFHFQLMKAEKEQQKNKRSSLLTRYYNKTYGKQ